MVPLFAQQNPIHPVFNVTVDEIQVAHDFFSKLSVPMVMEATDDGPTDES